MDAFDREEQIIIEQHENGEIDTREYNRLMRGLARDYAEAARESAQRAYDDEMGRW